VGPESGISIFLDPYIYTAGTNGTAVETLAVSGLEAGEAFTMFLIEAGFDRLMAGGLANDNGAAELAYRAGIDRIFSFPDEPGLYTLLLEAQSGARTSVPIWVVAEK